MLAPTDLVVCLQNAVDIDITIRDWVPHWPPGDCCESAHQDAVRIAIKTLKGYTGMRNADKFMSVLEEVWQLMSVGEWLAVWGWPEVACKIDLDFIPA
ncbi:hypothetical protein MFIFM68171_08914 [Madurella fahalii]|uniref:Uncharacterized protein n=1 Tax=Madurella fahalii TaxID=1157608 RepID=A0ABQ0GLX4_9PEZI